MKIGMFFKKNGFVLIQTIIFSALAVIFIGGLASWSGTILRSVKQTTNRELALQIAEAGVDYYRWHLAHSPLDFKDGTNLSGPYVHDFKNKEGEIIGQFSLTIIPPPTGSTLVTIRSVGSLVASSSATRSLEVKLAIPSWAKYAVAANDNMRFGDGTEVFGPIHSNKGIRFDGLAHNIISSALAKYDDPDHTGGEEFGVHTHVSPADPLPPASVPTRSDVFLAGRQFPLSVIDFAGLTSDLANMKTSAQSVGRYFAGSGLLGYHVVLKENGTFDLYKVKTLMSAPSGCSNFLSQSDWGTWTIKSSGGEQFLNNYTIPSNGILFFEDHVWVDGKINGSRVTIASGRFPDNPSTRTSITVNNNLVYTNYTGSDAISLVAQNNINAGLASADTLRIDGALVAQNGRIGRFYYSGSCRPYDTRNTITLYGMLATNQRYGFAYTDNTGYANRNIIYDGNLLYAPPPSFPLTSDHYQIISWQEI
jgi:hypothetical protein